MAKVFQSMVIKAPPEEVWKVIRDFNGLPSWHPGIAESRIEENRAPDSVGCVRNFSLTSGDGIREKLLALDDVNHLCTYTILESPMPLTNYTSCLRLYEITENGNTFAIWSAEFDTAPETREELCQTVGEGVFLTGLKALQERFA